MIRSMSFDAIAGLALSGCVQTTSADVDPLTAALAGRSLTNDAGTIDVNRDGTLSGLAEGAWTVRDGQWCRTISEPARLAGTACQDATLNGDGSVTIDGVNGPVTWAIQ
ncbi:MAG: hypothetical protein V2I65_07845 [Paracoccaceae bacterium]|jgi:hypothetical protein|nr:hypothetical protein [Paracoccaceae bacterium]